MDFKINWHRIDEPDYYINVCQKRYPIYNIN